MSKRAYTPEDDEVYEKRLCNSRGSTGLNEVVDSENTTEFDHNKKANVEIVKRGESCQMEPLRINYMTGDIFDAPPGTVLIHSCNCRGRWGKGIALAFKTRYPTAFQAYKTFCDGTNAKSLLGRGLLIPLSGKEKANKDIYIGCLFTSIDSGNKKSEKDIILDATKRSMTELLSKIAELDGNERPTSMRMPMINSGLFAVPWEETEAVIKGLKCSTDVPSTILVIARE